MTTLFRPWTEQNSVESAVNEMTSLYTEPLMNKSPEIWSPMTQDDAAQMEKSVDRETKYKSIKQHIRKRTEKYFLKKLKMQSEKKNFEPAAAEYSKPTDLGLPLTSCYFSADGCLNPFDCFLPNKPINPYIAPTMGPLNSEFVDATLPQNFPPSLFEEYAKFLTEQQKQVVDRNRKQRPKKFRCPHCHVGFSNNGQLKGHIRIHTGERPFKCDAESCGKSFTRNEELTRHRRIHSGLRPFPCSECGKRFGRKDHLKKHVKTHFQQRYQLVPILPSHYPYFYGL